MAVEPRANFIAGEFRPAARGARFPARGAQPAPGEREQSWPQSQAEDVAAAGRAAMAALADWRALGAARRVEFVCALARELERDPLLSLRLGRRFQLEPGELAAHSADLERDLAERLERPTQLAGGVAWCAPEWRELVRAPLFDLSRELCAGRTAVLLSDARLPELGEHLALAAHEAGLPAGVLGLLHGATRELVGLALEGARAEDTLVASGLVARMVELRRACERRGLSDPRLRALRCGTFEVGEDGPPAELEASAARVVERAFGRGATLTGQLPGALGRVFCPARLFSRFSELLLEQLERSPAARAPVPQIDEEANARARAACELGLDEGATCIAGGSEGAGGVFPPTLFTNVEGYMSAARRQDPLPVLCLLRAP